MGIFTIKLPDVGEGIAEAELSEWNVAVGDIVREDDILGSVMTDKAAVEVPTSVSGTVAWLCGEPGDTIAIGAKFIQIEVDGPGNDNELMVSTQSASQAAPQAAAPVRPAETAAAPEIAASEPANSEKRPAPTPPHAPAALNAAPSAPAQRTRPLRMGEKPLAAPSVRQAARDVGIDLRQVEGSGPAGRILHGDIEAFAAGGGPAAAPTRKMPATATREVKVIGMRRRIAEKMALSKARIPHITIVEEVDVSAVEDLRANLNKSHAARGKLTLLPFIIRAIVTAVRAQPELNARYDDEAGIVHQHSAVHVGIATQTPAGLTVPVVRHAETLSLWDSAAEIIRLAESARDGKATRDDLSGSTISITSLGALGAIATTPIINHPEVAIVGINKMAVRPMWDGQAFQPRRMMNISCSFDHRVIDGWDAAVFVQKLKTLIETPALLFIED